jgi:hypothetical protein
LINFFNRLVVIGIRGTQAEESWFRVLVINHSRPNILICSPIYLPSSKMRQILLSNHSDSILHNSARCNSFGNRVDVGVAQIRKSIGPWSESLFLARYLLEV